MAARPPVEPITMGNYTDLPPEQRPGYAQQRSQGATASPSVTYAQPGHVQYAPTGQQFAYTAAPSTHASGGFQYAHPPDTIAYTSTPVASNFTPPSAVRHTTQPTGPSYPSQPQLQYTARSQAPLAQAPPPPPAAQPTYPPPPTGAPSHRPDNFHTTSQPGPTTTHDGRRVVEMVPSGGSRTNAPPSPGLRPHSLSVNGSRPDALTPRMDRLSVSGNRPDIQTIVPGGLSGGMMGGGLPPPSPLLEAYHGTYQSISPMVPAIMLDDDLDHLPSLDSFSPRASSQSVHGRLRAHSTSRRSPSPASRSEHRDKLAMEAYGGGKQEKEKRRARVYDATEDALALVEAMAARTPDLDAIVDILPALSHDQMLELRSEYKRHCKVQGRGINIAKHIKLKTSGNFGKIAYVTALGKYEGEGYWANYWYQSNSARRELLIEALMGRQNYEIREIKEAFRDKRYSDSLIRCMDKELKADKFRKAVLMVLEGQRQEESDAWPIEYRNRDVDTLYKAMNAREGGESTMLNVVLMRSDAHLREVLRTYERKYQSNFARDALRKSNNLVVSGFHSLKLSTVI